MIARLVDILGDFIRLVEIPDAVADKISALTVDDVPYFRVDVDAFQMANGFYATRSRVVDALDIGRLFSTPLIHDLRTTTWYSGINGEAMFDIDATVRIPWAESFTIRIRDRRPIRLNNLWCPERIEQVQHNTPAAVRAAFVQAARCRNLTNDFLNTNRPKGTRVVASIIGLDTTSRLICDLYKVVPAIAGKTKELRLSLQEHLLKSGLFQPIGWRRK